MSRAIALLLLAALLPMPARADDSGPGRTVAQLRSEARRLLARQVRASGVDPKSVVISDVVADENQALLSWDSGKQHGLAGFSRVNDRWWLALDATSWSGCWVITNAYPLQSSYDAFPAAYMLPDYEPPPSAQVLSGYGLSQALTALAAVHNADVRDAGEAFAKSRHGNLMKPVGCNAATYPVKPDVAVHARGGIIHPARFQTSGYDVTLSYASNDSASARFTQMYFRPPTEAEFLPNHAVAPGWGYADAVCYFDFSISGPQPVTFKPGSTIDVWFPFMLDDDLRYTLNVVSNDVGPVHGTIFDNTLHFVLPAFTLTPGKPLMAEIDGDPKPRS